MTATVDPRVERTRSVVLRAAADLLAEEGFEQITIDGIAERSGVARSTIYRNWPDRARLLIEAFEVVCDFPPPPDTGSLASDLGAFARLLADGLANADWGRSLPSLIGAAAHDPELHRAMLAFNAERRAHVEAVVRRAVERGEVPRGTEIELPIIRFAAAFFFARLMTDRPLDEAYADEIVRRTLVELGAA